jgi:CHAD domain-containing protein
MAIKETVEREVKLRAGEAFRLPELGGEPIEPRLFVSTYHDTDDHRLARHGITLRHRVENGKGLWQLKLPHGVSRLELEAPGAPTEPPVELLGLLTGQLRGVPLLPIARLQTRREGVRADGAEIVHDTVAVLDHQRVTRRFEELEVELLDGDEKTLRRLEKALRRAGAADGESRPKVFQALDLDFQPEPLEGGGDTSAAGVLRTRLREQAEQLLAHDPGTRLGTDPEELHQLRVATRRLRAFLRAGRDLLDPETAEPLRAELRWLGSALGPVRDLDVLIERLDAEVLDLGADETQGRKLVRTLDRSRRSARRRLLTALDSARYFALLDTLERPFATVADEPALDEIRVAEHKRLHKAVKALAPDSPDEELHAARIRVKRARYAAELEGDRAYVQAAKRLQDVLGEHQDAVVAIGKLRDLAARMPDAAVAAGRLIEREHERARRTRDAWKASWKQLAKTV